MDVQKDVVARVSAFSSEAKIKFKRQEYHKSLSQYQKALELCRQHDGLVEERELTSSNCAKVCLELQLYGKAVTYAEECIGLNPNSHKGYFVRAKALMKALDSSRYTVKASPGYADVIQNYIHSHQLKQNASAFCEAILVAVNHERNDLIVPVMRTQDHEFCKKLFQKLLLREEATAKHFKLVINCTPPFDASQVQLSKLLKKQFTDKNYVEVLFGMGMKVKKVDIETAVELLPESNIDMLNLLVSKYRSRDFAVSSPDPIPASDFDEACKNAMHAKKFRFAACLGAMASNPLAIVSGVKDVAPEKKIDLICFFLEQGADCTLLSNPLHVATQLAVETDGDTRAIHAVVKAPAFIETVPKDGRILDSKKQTPIHLAVIRVKKAISSKILLALAESEIPINPFVKDDRGKKARDYLNKEDSRNKDLDNATKRFRSLTGATEKGKNKRDSNLSPLDTPELNATLNNTSSQSMTPTEEDPNVPQSTTESSIPEGKEQSDMSDSTSEKLNMLEGKEPKESSNMHEVLDVPSSMDELESKKEKQCILTEKEEPCVRHESNKHEGSPSRASKTTAKHPVAKRDYEQLTLQEKLTKQLNRIYANRAEYFIASPIPSSEGDRFYKQEQPSSKEVFEDTLVSATPTRADCGEETTKLSRSNTLLHHCDPVNEDSYFMSPPDRHKQPSHSHEPKLPKNQSSKNESSCDDQTAMESQQLETSDNETQDPDHHPNTVIELSTLKDLPWEVEATEKVIKFFKNKKIPQWLHEKAILKIKMLAIGDWHSPKICKPVLSDSRPAINLVLNETRLTKSARILWEVTEQFSSRRTDKPKSSCDKVDHVYSEVIRVWDIVLDHDQLDRCIKHIRKSHDRGRNASIQPLLVRPMTRSQFVPNERPVSSGIRLPRQFRLCSELEGANEDNFHYLPFIPAGCTKEHEHNVITFYDISDALLDSMLNGEDARRDFPIKEWPGEFDIIEMPYDQESILLLGRSGTGKTTCCLYRLWNHFQIYWSNAATAGRLISRKPPAYEPEKEGASLDSDTQDGNTTCISVDVLASNDEQSSNSEILEHLHPVFISKNYVLSAQMKKRFYDLAAADPVFESHMPHEDKPLPNSLIEIEDFAYPLFLTARQFFLLLDNSLGNGEPFFPRAKDGSLAVKILSSDYDHENPDTLLDLIEESDDEDDEFDDYDVQEHGSQKKQLQLQEHKEVTAAFFEKQIWPEISKKSTHNCKEIDPLLVWMEIKSFIKGSRQALESDQGFLSECEYQVLGKKMAPNFPGNRSEIYELFNLYQSFLQRARHQHFDECDFIHSIHTRLKNPENLDWSIHTFYVDEVQDFTQAELSILLQVCRNPNGLFLTGDTAQSIMRGVSFRFADLRAHFHELNEKAKQSKASISVKVPFVRHLEINFRSHTGILQLAASIIDLLMHFFPSSFDRLPEDKGMFPGPIPILLHSCNVSDLAVLLRGNKREASTIEFGAHQVIIVQSEEAKKALPDVLKAGIVLTVFEAKGLEFDDVLLYNFFADSKVSKEWRVVTSFIGLEKNAAMIQERTLAFESQPRPLDFNERQHKSLNSELKYLYTAVTRAKCNLWIYDSDEAKRLPVFDYWHKRGRVKVIQINDISKEDESGVFVTSSTKEEWKEQGDYFKKKQLWEPAKKCYKKAGDTLLEMESEAYSLAQQARERKGGKEKQDLYLEAALAFLKCDELHHEAKLLSIVAKCMKNAKRYSDAAKLFEKLGQHDKARSGFKKSKDLDGLAYLKEKEGDYSGAVQVYIDNNRRIEALKRSTAYERMRKPLDESVRVQQLAIKTAKAYAKPKDAKRLEVVLEYVQDASQRIKFLKDVCLYSKASDLHIREHQFMEAYRIFSAQAMYSEGIKLAEEQKHLEMRAKFIFQAAVAHMGGTVGTMTDQQIINKLKELSEKCRDFNSKAQAYLLHGKMTDDAGFCQKAVTIYCREARNAIGEVESFNALVAVSSPKTKSEDAFIAMAVSACKAAKTVIDAIENQRSPTPSNEYCMKQVDDFYCLQRHRQHDASIYTLPRTQDIWVQSLTTQPNCSSDLDPDGMIRIEIPMALNLIKGHMGSCISKWVEMDPKLDIVLQTRMQRFPFHKVLEMGGYLQESFLTYTPDRLTEYLRACLRALEFINVANSKHFSNSTFQAVFLNVFSPQATVFLPVKQSHFKTVRASKAACHLLSGIAAERIAAQMEKLDNWLDVWRIHCILGRGTKKLDSIMAEKATQVNTKAGKGNYRTPYTFVFNSADERYAHVFSMWLKACSLVHKEKIIVSSKIIVGHFVQIIAKRKSLRPTISVINLVNIVSIFSTALLAVTSQCCQLLGQTFTIAVPSSYLHIVKFFDILTCQESHHDTRLLKACVEEVKRNERANSLLNLKQRAIELLTKILNVLVGKFNQHCNVLRYAFHGNTLENGEAQHCLVLILILFGNLTPGFSREQVAEYQQIILVSLQSLSRILPSRASPAIQHLQRACSSAITANNVNGIFHAIHQLISVSDGGAHFVRFKVVRKDGKLSKMETPIFPIQEIPPHPIAPLQIPSPPLHVQSPGVSPQRSHSSPTFTAHTPIAMHVQDQLVPPQQQPMQFSHASVAGTEQQPMQFSHASVAGTEQQPMQFSYASVAVPQQQPVQLSHASVAGTEQQPMQFSHAPVAGTEQQPMQFSYASVAGPQQQFSHATVAGTQQQPMQFSYATVAGPQQQPMQFPYATVAGPQQQPMQFPYATVAAPQQQPMQFPYATVAAPQQQPMQFSHASVAGTEQQPMQFSHVSVAVPQQQPVQFSHASVAGTEQQPMQFSHVSVAVPQQQPVQFSHASVAGTEQQPMQFSYASVAVPQQQPMQFSHASVAGPQQQPMQFSHASVAGPQQQPTSWNPAVSPSHPAGATLVDNVFSSYSKPGLQETQTVTVSESLSDGVRPESVIASQALGSQSESEPLADHQLFSSSSGVEVNKTSTIPQYSRQTSHTDVDETELEDPEADAPVMDEEIQEALASTDDVEKTELQESEIQETHDQMWSLVDEGVCKICGIPLNTSVPVDTESDVVDQPSEIFKREDVAGTSESETRESHIKSNKHKEMERQYSVFCQKTEWLYEYKATLLEELKECQELDDPPSYLEILITKIEEEMNSNDQKVENYKRSCEWKEGASEIENVMMDCMSSLIQQAIRERQRAITEKEQSMKQQRVEIQQPAADDELVGAEFEKEEIIEYSASTVEAEKQKERKKKRSRKMKRRN